MKNLHKIQGQIEKTIKGLESDIKGAREDMEHNKGEVEVHRAVVQSLLKKNQALEGNIAKAEAYIAKLKEKP